MRILRLLLTIACSLASLDARAEDSEVAALGWLAGCWSAEGAEAGSVEHWLPPAGGTMLGVSRTIKNGATVAHEYMQIRTVDGKLAFIALPSGQKETTFTLAKLGKGEVTFENPKHDFPQRVIYRSLPGERLMGRIEGVIEGKAKSFDFPMKRTPCDPLAKPAPSK
jgi:hypothetical protein